MFLKLNFQSVFFHTTLALLLAYHYFSYVRFLVIFLLAPFLLNLRKMKAKPEIFFLLCLSLAIPIVLHSNIFSYFLNMRFVYGSVIIAIIFSSVKMSARNFINLGIVLSFLTVFEKLCIMLSPDLINYLGNYDSGHTFSLGTAEWVFGGVHGVGANRSVTATLLCVFLQFALDQRAQIWRIFVIAFAVMSCSSGTGFVLLAVIAILQIYNSVSWRRIGVSQLFIGCFFFSLLLYFLETSFFNKFSYSYLSWTADYKINAIQDYLSRSNILQVILGHGDKFFSGAVVFGVYGSFYGDFALLDATARVGVLGVGLLCLTLVLLGPGRYLCIAICLLGTIHYGAIFSFPVQVCLGLLLGMSQRGCNMLRAERDKRQYS